MSQDNRPGAVDELATLYRETILRHATEPVGFGTEIDATHQCEKYNPLCGDRIEMHLRIEDATIEAAAFTGRHALSAWPQLRSHVSNCPARIRQPQVRGTPG